MGSRNNTPKTQVIGPSRHEMLPTPIQPEDGKSLSILDPTFHFVS